MKRFEMIILFSICAITVCAQDIEAILHVADSLSAQPEKAMEVVNQALADYPDSEELLKVRAEAYETLKHYDKAIADYKKLTQMEPDADNFWYLLGRNQFLNGQLEDALKSLDRSIKLNAKYLPAYHTKIQVLLQLNQDAAALKVSDLTLSIAETTMNYFLQGEVYRKMKSWQKAEWAYQSATKIDKGFIAAYIALADIYVNTNKGNEALEAAEEALGIDPDSQEALITRSRGFALLRNYTDAIDDISFAIRLHPNNISAYIWRGNFYIDAGKPQEAIQDFEFVLKNQPENWKALEWLADAYAILGDKKKALEGYQKLINIAVQFPEKDTIIQLAERKIFELNREDRAPTLVLSEPKTDNFVLQVPDNLEFIILKGIISDESAIKSLIINGKKIPVTAIGNDFEFTTEINLEDIQEIQIEVSDVYDNVAKLAYNLIRTETRKPQIELFIPKPSETGLITLSDGGTTLYIEGKITDESAILSILVDGKAVDFDQDAINPFFSTILDINNKTRFSITATDFFGNTAEEFYTIGIINQ